MVGQAFTGKGYKGNFLGAGNFYSIIPICQKYIAKNYTFQCMEI